MRKVELSGLTPINSISEGLTPFIFAYATATWTAASGWPGRQCAPAVAAISAAVLQPDHIEVVIDVGRQAMYDQGANRERHRKQA